MTDENPVERFNTPYSSGERNPVYKGIRKKENALRSRFPNV
jgi:hypothetical protein